MLQRNKGTEKLLQHADFLDQLEPERFSMRQWGMIAEPRCICGWLMHNECRMDKDNWEAAGAMLGMDVKTASRMFSQPLIDHVSNKEAAKALRHYAVTGEFNGW